MTPDEYLEAFTRAILPGDQEQNDPPKTMFLEIGRRRFQIASFKEASRMFCAARDKAGEGASRTPTPLIVDERGSVIGHVSYNGRVWGGTTYVVGAQPLYDNR